MATILELESTSTKELQAALGRRRAFGLLLFFVTVVLSARMYGHYLFDDSFFGFSYAQNLAEGHGFVFNSGERYLGTSAPLVVPIYAFLNKFFGLSIPMVAQIGSFVLLSIGSLALYALLSTEGSVLAAFFASLVFVTTPLMTMVVSHESLLYLCLGLASVWALSRNRFILAGILIGLATLCRMEAVTLGFASFVLIGLRKDERGLIRYCGAAGLILVPWVAFATAYFGSPLSNTVEAKHLQVMYGNSPFLRGIPGWIHNLYRGPLDIPSLGILTVGGLAFARRLNRWIVLLCAWVGLQSMIYVVLDEAFYHWFIAQLSIPLALLAYGAIRLVGESEGTRRAVAGFAVVGALVSLLVSQIGAIFQNNNRIQDFAYYRLAQWVKANTPASAKVAYLEIGILKFYSQRFIVDWLGLVTPGVLPHLKVHNTSWIIKKYHPDYFIQNDLFDSYLNCEQLDWFKRAYRLKAVLSDLGYPIPLKIYELSDRRYIPRPAELLYWTPSGDHASGEILPGQPLTQALEIHGRATALDLELATEGHRLSSHYLLEVAEQGKPVCHIEVSANDVFDNAYRTFTFARPLGEGAHHLTLTLTTQDARPGNALVAWLTPQRAGSDGHGLRLGDAVVQGELCTQVQGAIR